MKKRSNIYISIASLLAGGILYVLFRENSYLGKLFAQCTVIIRLKALTSPLDSDLSKFHLPDFLWGLSLGCSLQAALGMKGYGILICGFVPFLCGALWECMQFFGIIPGTGDYWDIVSYFLAGAICIIINLKERKE